MLFTVGNRRLFSDRLQFLFSDRPQFLLSDRPQFLQSDRPQLWALFGTLIFRNQKLADGPQNFADGQPLGVLVVFCLWKDFGAF